MRKITKGSTTWSPSHRQRIDRSFHGKPGVCVKMGEEKRAFKGVWICAAIFLDEKLTPGEKILSAEIDSLTTDDHGCYASNAHFAKRLGVTASRANHIVARLTREGTSFGCVMTAEFRTGLYRRSSAAIRLLH